MEESEDEGKHEPPSPTRAWRKGIPLASPPLSFLLPFIHHSDHHEVQTVEHELTSSVT